ncbi:MAG: cobalt ECF transporter T component CbiQ [Thermovirgaceae bacterium]|nr:cobalt ECF transporter T component CbiQ [Thermovirgaceae bacterium]
MHRLDPRAKWLVTLAFAVTATSFGKYEIARLMPLFFYPFAMIALSGVAVADVLRRTALAAPFILLAGLFNPFFDRHVLISLWGFPLTGGWVSFLSITLRSVLVVSSVVLLSLTTRSDRLFSGLGELGVPSIFVVQLQFLNRYILLLAGEVQRIVRAHSLRSGSRRNSVSLFLSGSMLGILLLKSMDRAARVHWAMLARGFDGEVRTACPLKFSWQRDGAFVLIWVAFFGAVRFIDIPFLLFGWAVGK